MNDKKPRASHPSMKYTRLLLVFLSAAIAVFGLLYQQMWTHSGGFDYYAFEYWGPRAFGVVVATTAIGTLVVNQGWKVRVAFGAVAGLALSFLYVWVAT